MENIKLIEKALKILNTDLDTETTPAEIQALKGMSLETGLNYILENAKQILNFDTARHALVDWSKVPIDTPILVKDLTKNKWEPKHFAGYYAGMVHAYISGQTSHTTEDGFVPWNYAKLAEPIHNTDTDWCVKNTYPDQLHNSNAELDDLLDELENSPESARDDIRAKIHKLFERKIK